MQQVGDNPIDRFCVGTDMDSATQNTLSAGKDKEGMFAHPTIEQ